MILRRFTGIRLNNETPTYAPTIKNKVVGIIDFHLTLLKTVIKRRTPAIASKRLESEIAVTGLNKMVNDGTIIRAGPNPEKPLTK